MDQAIGARKRSGYQRVFGKWLWLVGLGAVLAASLSLAVLSRQRPLYRARTLLLIGRLDTTASPEEIVFWNRIANSYMQLLRRESLLQTVLETTQADLSVDELSSQLEIALLSNTQLLEIAVTNPIAQQAKLLADISAQQLIAQSRHLSQNLDVDTLQKQIAELQGRLETARSALQDLANQISSTQDASVLQELRSQRSDLVLKITLLESSYAALTNQLDKDVRSINPLSVVEIAALPANPLPVAWGAVLVLGAGCGAVFGGALALLLDRVDNTLHSPSTINTLLGTQVLAIVPPIRTKRGEDKLIHRQSASSYYAEPYRMLRANLLFGDGAGAEAACRILAVTSARADEGKSLTVANLGIALAQAGRRVLIIDADLRTPMQHRLFKLNNRDGLTSLLYEFVLHHNLYSMADNLKQTDIPNLAILTSGPLPPNPSQVIGSVQMLNLIRTLAAQFDFILLDSPPILTAADMLTLAPNLDGVLLVIDAQRTKRRIGARAMKALQHANAPVIGVVLNRLRPQVGRKASPYVADQRAADSWEAGSAPSTPSTQTQSTP